jgi:hypothetical protein
MHHEDGRLRSTWLIIGINVQEEGRLINTWLIIGMDAQ